MPVVPRHAARRDRHHRLSEGRRGVGRSRRRHQHHLEPVNAASPLPAEGGHRWPRGGLSIRARLVALSITLVALTVGTNLFLSGALRATSDAAMQSDRLIRVIGATNDVRSAFADLRYWMTDLAVSLLMLSERNADDARRRLQARLTILQTYEPDVAAAVRAESLKFDEAATRAVDAYTKDQRVIGNSLIAEARQHGLRVDTLLSALDAQLAVREQEARDQVLRSTATATRVSLAVVAAAVLLGILLTLLVLRSI